MIIFFIASIVSFVVSYRSFKEKGYCINNVYIYASKKEREIMNKSPIYKQREVVFLAIGINFLSVALSYYTKSPIFDFIVGIMIVFLIIYAIISSIYINKKYNYFK